MESAVSTPAPRIDQIYEDDFGKRLAESPLFGRLVKQHGPYVHAQVPLPWVPSIAIALRELGCSRRSRVTAAWNLSPGTSYPMPRRLLSPFLLRQCGADGVESVEAHGVLPNAGSIAVDDSPVVSGVPAIRYREHKSVAEALTRAMTRSQLCVMNDADLLAVLHDPDMRAVFEALQRTTPVLCMMLGGGLANALVKAMLWPRAMLGLRITLSRADGDQDYPCCALFPAGGLEGGLGESPYLPLVEALMADGTFGAAIRRRVRDGFGDVHISFGGNVDVYLESGEVVLANTTAVQEMLPSVEQACAGVDGKLAASLVACQWWLDKQEEQRAKPSLQEELGIPLLAISKEEYAWGAHLMQDLFRDPARYYRQRRRDYRKLIDSRGRTPLHWAALAADAEVGRMLLEDGWNPVEVDLDGWSPLAYAAASEHFALVEMLLEYTSDDPTVLPGGVAVMDLVAAFYARLGIDKWGADAAAAQASLDELWEAVQSAAREGIPDASVHGSGHAALASAVVQGLRGGTAPGGPMMDAASAPAVLAAAMRRADALALDLVIDGAAPVANSSDVMASAETPVAAHDAKANPVIDATDPVAARAGVVVEPEVGIEVACAAEVAVEPPAARLIETSEAVAMPEEGVTRSVAPSPAGEPVMSSEPIMSWVAELRAADAMSLASQRVRDWLSGAGIRLEEGDHLQGESDAGSVIGDVSHDGAMLAVRHDDRRTPNYIFRSEIVLATLGERTFASLRLGVLRARGAGPVTPTVPRLVREWAALEAVDAGWPVGRLLRARDREDGTRVVEHIQSEARNQPVAVLKAGRYGNVERLLPAQLLAGATCVLIDDAAVGTFDAAALGAAMPPGALQIFPPRASGGSLGSEVLVRNPWGMPKHGLIAEVAKALSWMTRDRLALDDGVPSYLGARRLITERRMRAAASQAQASSRVHSDEVRVLREDVRVLQALLVEADAERTALQARHREQLESLSDRKVALEQQVAALRATVARLRDAATNPAEYPASFADLESWAAEVFPANVFLTSRALKGALAANSDAKTVKKVYACLELLANEYVDMLSGVAGAREALNDRLKELSVEICPVGMATEHPRYGGEYQVRHEGRLVKLDSHISGSSSRKQEKSLRIYFTWLKNPGHLVIGWLPTHLTNSLT